MASISTSGLIIVEQRVDDRLPPRFVQPGGQVKLPLKASTTELGLFALLLFGSVVVAFYVATLRLPTEELIGSAVHQLSGLVGCKAPL